jgi:hypothetical protein
VTPLLRRYLVSGFGFGLLTALNGCVVGGAGYAGGVGVAYGADYYEPYGYEYGGWGAGYHVGPPRGGDRRPDHSGNSHPPAYHPAPPSRSTPSIPSRPRGR